MGFFRKALREIKRVKALWKRKKEYWLLLKGVFLRSKLLSPNDKDDLIVSLTTYNKRLDKVHVTIESLLQQSRKPNRIILWLYEGEVRALSHYLKFQQTRGVEIRFVDENLKSFKKLLYTYKEFPTSNIITVDDDIIYPKTFIEKFEAAALEFPGSILCYRAKLIEMDSQDSLKPYKSLIYACKMQKPSHKILPIGCSGIYYPPNSLHRFVLNKEYATLLCDNADDIWFKVMALMSGVKANLVLDSSIHFPLTYATQSDSLHKLNNVDESNNGSKNDKALKQTINVVNKMFNTNLYKSLSE
ncbi:hypothetical protein KUL156_27780 [Alteromonas sp. KUL156]|nr:hypothetical protein KUL154_49400 [Alteromonas sp. KUL154]GFE00186.1 hypothetical protein KUL156_27780 [Alteromonas sp. KUL156]